MVNTHFPPAAYSGRVNSGEDANAINVYNPTVKRFSSPWRRRQFVETHDRYQYACTMIVHVPYIFSFQYHGTFYIYVFDMDCYAIKNAQTQVSFGVRMDD